MLAASSKAVTSVSRVRFFKAYRNSTRSSLPFLSHLSANPALTVTNTEVIAVGTSLQFSSPAFSGTPDVSTIPSSSQRFLFSRVRVAFTGPPLPDAHRRHALLPLPPDRPVRRARRHQWPSRNLDHVGRSAAERRRSRPPEQRDRRGPPDDLHQLTARRARLARPEERQERQWQQRREPLHDHHRIAR